MLRSLQLSTFIAVGILVAFITPANADNATSLSSSQIDAFYREQGASGCVLHRTNARNIFLLNTSDAYRLLFIDTTRPGTCWFRSDGQGASTEKTVSVRCIDASIQAIYAEKILAGCTPEGDLSFSRSPNKWAANTEFLREFRSSFKDAGIAESPVMFSENIARRTFPEQRSGVISFELWQSEASQTTIAAASRRMADIPLTDILGAAQRHELTLSDILWLGPGLTLINKAGEIFRPQGKLSKKLMSEAKFKARLKQFNSIVEIETQDLQPDQIPESIYSDLVLSFLDPEYSPNLTRHGFHMPAALYLLE